MDALDYTPEQALYDATLATQHADYDGAFIVLFRNQDEAAGIDITHFISGASGLQLVSYLDVLKTKFSLQVLGLTAGPNE